MEAGERGCGNVDWAPTTTTMSLDVLTIWIYSKTPRWKGQNGRKARTNTRPSHIFPLAYVTMKSEENRKNVILRWIDLLWEHSRTCCNNVNSQRGSRHKRVRLRRLHQFGYRSLLFRDRDVACTRSTNYVYQVAATQPTCSGFHDQIFITRSCNWVTRRISRLTFVPIVLHWNFVSNWSKFDAYIRMYIGCVGVLSF